MELNSQQFVEALKAPDRDDKLQEFLDDHNMNATVSEILEIAQMVCKVLDVVCPIIEEI